MQEKGTEIGNLSACCHASLHLGLNKCRAQHKASLKSALSPPPEAAKADPSPHPAPQAAVPVWFSRAQHWILQQRAHAAAADSKSPGQRLQCIKQQNGHCSIPPLLHSCWNLTPSKPPPQHLHCSLGRSTGSSGSLQRLQCPPACGKWGCCKEMTLWERRIYGSGYEWWERGKGIPLLLEQRNPVRIGRCCRKHEGSQHPSEEGSAPFSLAATQAQTVINPQNVFFFFKNRPPSPTGSLNKSLAPVLFSSRSPGSAVLSLQHWYFSMSVESSEPQGCGHRCAS